MLYRIEIKYHSIHLAMTGCTKKNGIDLDFF